MTTESLKNESILIVDDEPANLKLLDKILRSQGYQGLVLVEDPRKVIDLYRASPPILSFSISTCRTWTAIR